MRLYNLHLKNIGPFLDADIEFLEEDHQEQPPVTIITGENGTGKTIVLDAIRSILLAEFQSIERNIVREESNFTIALDTAYGTFKEKFKEKITSEKLYEKGFDNNHARVSLIIESLTANKERAKYFQYSVPGNFFDIDWVIDYWSSKLSADSFEIKSLVSPDPYAFMKDALTGVHPNVEVTQLICFFDYLRSSESPKEKEAGEFLYSKLKEIISLSLNNGELAYVARTKLQPVIRQNGMEITLNKLSSGNLYLVQRLVSMLGKMYAVHILQESPVETICDTPGLLLIDEAENHLHPKWQKTFISNILKIFPNLQIILTTHSPFIVSSVKNAKVYVCKAEDDHCVIVDETEEYSNMPVEEILMSPLFGETSPFSKEITDLMKERKQAIKEGNKQRQLEIEQQLKEANPEYFSYLDIDNLLDQLKGGQAQ